MTKPQTAETVLVERDPNTPQCNRCGTPLEDGRCSYCAAAPPPHDGRGELEIPDFLKRQTGELPPLTFPAWKDDGREGSREGAEEDGSTSFEDGWHAMRERAETAEAQLAEAKGEVERLTAALAGSSAASMTLRGKVSTLTAQRDRLLEAGKPLIDRRTKLFGDAREDAVEVLRKAHDGVEGGVVEMMLGCPFCGGIKLRPNADWGEWWRLPASHAKLADPALLPKPKPTPPGTPVPQPLPNGGRGWKRVRGKPHRTSRKKRRGGSISLIGNRRQPPRMRASASPATTWRSPFTQAMTSPKPTP